MTDTELLRELRSLPDIKNHGDLQLAIESRLAQAWAFRTIALDLLLGKADKWPSQFIANAKSICREAAEKGA